MARKKATKRTTKKRNRPKVPPRRELGRPKKYNWEDILDGEDKVLTQGEDFVCRLETMSSYLYRIAKRHGKKIFTNSYPEKKQIVIYFKEGTQ